MAKTIRDFLKTKSRRGSQPEYRTFYLNDVLDADPTQYCPNCNSMEIIPLRTHDAEGADYQCNSCNGTYEIVHYNRGEDVH